jgi:hypothetical protein
VEAALEMQILRGVPGAGRRIGRIRNGLVEVRMRESALASAPGADRLLAMPALDEDLLVVLEEAVTKWATIKTVDKT